MIKEKEMPSEKHECCQEVFKRGKHHHSNCNCGQSSALYGLGVIGALFYFLQNATTFTAVMVGIFKAVFWPAFIVFKVLTNLGI
jgi:hypothetical protein